MPNPPLVTIDAVVKRFGAVTAVDRPSLEVREGEILALLGPNGAGKSTLLRMLVGILRPDDGAIRHRLAMADAHRPSRRELGYLPEDRGLYPDMPVLRTLVYFGVLHGMPRAEAARAAAPWLERLGLAERAGDAVKTLSKGNQQKVQFVAAVLHRPRLAVLDEPFSGLDPLNQDLFIDLVRELRDTGTTVLFSAHEMSLVERLAHRVAIMRAGTVALEGTIAELRERWHTGERLVVQLAGEPVLAPLADHPDVARLTTDADGTLHVEPRPGAPLGPLLRTLGEHVDVRRIRSESVSLHDIYVRTAAGAAAPDDAASGVRAPDAPLPATTPRHTEVA